MSLLGALGLDGHDAACLREVRHAMGPLMALAMAWGLLTQNNCETANAIGTFSYTASGARVNPTGTNTGFHILRGLDAIGLPGDFAIPAPYLQGLFRVDTLPATGSEEIVVLTDASNNYKCTFRVTSAGKLQFYASDGTTQLGTDSTYTIVAGTLYRVALLAGTGTSVPWEWRLFNVATNLIGDLIVQLDGQSGTGANLGTGNFARLRLGKVTNRNGQSIDATFKWWEVDDAGWPDYHEMAYLPANANGSTQVWNAGTGGSDWQEVVSANDASYCQSQTSGAPNAALFGFGSCASVSIPASAAHAAAKLITRNAEAIAATSACLMRVRSGATNSDSSTQNAGTTVTPRQRWLTTDPDTGLPWTTAGLDAVEGGLVENNNVAQRISFATMLVVFTPAPTKVEKTIKPAGGGNYATGADYIAAWPHATQVNQQWSGYVTGVLDEKFLIPATYRLASRLCYHELTSIGADRPGKLKNSGARIVYSGTLADGEDVWFSLMPYTRISWLEISYTGPPTGGAPDASSAACKNNGFGQKAHNLYIHDVEISARTRGLSGIAGGDKDFFGIRVENIRGTTDASGIKLEAPVGSTVWVVGCTAANVRATSGNGWGFDFNTLAGSTLYSRNNVAVDCDKCFHDQSDPGGTIDQDHCYSDDATADDFGGANNQTGIVAADQFVSLTGTIDLSLKPTADLRDAGEDLGDTPWAIDCLGRNRHTAGDTWDVGAHEYVEPTTALLMRRRMRRHG